MSTILVGGGTIALTYVSLIYFSMMHFSIFKNFPDVFAFAALAPAIYLDAGVVYLWISTIRSDPGYPQRCGSANAPLEGERVPSDAVRSVTDHEDDEGSGSDNNNANADTTDSSLHTESLSERFAQFGDHVERSLFGGNRYCKRCNIDKGKVIHHCRICDRCITEFDHHCPLVANCIGRANRGKFLSLLAHALLGCYYLLATSIMQMSEFPPRHPELWSRDFYLLGVFVIACATSVAFTCLFVWFFYLALMGVTSLEFGLLAKHKTWRSFVPWKPLYKLNKYLAPVGVRWRALLWYTW